MSKKSKKTHDSTIFTFSTSSLDALEKCPYSWYLRYIDQNYPEVQEPVTDFGNLVHEVGENYFGGGQDELKRLVKQFEVKYILTPEFELKLPLALARIDAFYTAKLADSPKVFHEKEIRLALEGYEDHIDVTGKIDVLYKDINEWVIADYKSSKKFGDFTKQFAFYYYLASKINKNIPETFKFQSVYLCAGSGIEIKDFVKEIVLEKSDIEITESRIQFGIDKILKLGVDDVTKWKKCPSILCSWCKYQNSIPQICEGNGKGKRII